MSDSDPKPALSLPILTAGDLTLRQLGDADIPGIVAQCTDPDSVRFTNAPTPYTAEDAARYVREVAPEGWRSESLLTFAIEYRGEFAGSLSLRPEEKIAKLGFGLAPWARRQHVMTRAIRLAIGWAFDRLDVDAVHWTAGSENWASVRVAWALGFRILGPVPALLNQRGVLVDGWFGSLQRDSAMLPTAPWLEPVPLFDDASEETPILLRAIEEADLERFAEGCADPLTQSFSTMLEQPFTLDSAHRYLQRSRIVASTGSGVTWAATLARNGTLIGSVALFNISFPHANAEIGYWLHPDSRGLGLAQRIVARAARHALIDVDDGGLGLQRITARVMTPNSASVAVLEKVGFTKVGREFNGLRGRDGQPQDSFLFELLP
ncbi:GNAT family N-acetyltransferase [Saxibacter everestensis]|uniref:GNAT family N-acetyltransferase n=1 Tax=Saxibacter everestensis TaxID=2909229 RepID=A0ABY8QQT9_9MICO|nr:GNAT family N-acetyltransferase [Brevibacteriaceae bacterium ZFBP1038]